MSTIQLDPAEAKLQVALQEVVASGLNKRGQPKLSIRSAAAKYGVPRSTLTARYNGRKTCIHGHVHQQLLPPSQEQVLKAWIKSLAARGIPLAPPSVAEYAAVIAGRPVSIKWVSGFRDRHPDIVARWTTGLETCHARSLNQTQVTEFFDILADVVTRYEIKHCNIYNMDEKGVQLGVGKRTRVLVDRDQKNVQQLENGSRELVTIIEAVSADGVALRPSVIYKGKRRNLAWARVNPCDASLSVSPNGWTDNDLGLKWLMYDFHPASKTRTENDNEYRLLILDGHNSHCGYPFVDFCEKNRIVLLCLPAHTTHALQPCDVGVFGPLAASWKAEVNAVSRLNIAITKDNFLEIYSRARARAFSSSTIISAFRKTGIYPFNPAAIPQSAFAPALNTTTQAAQPVPTELPSMLIPVSHAETSPSSSRTPSVPASESPSAVSEAGTEAAHPVAAYTLISFPSPIRKNATRQEYIEANQKLRDFALRAKEQMEADFASKKLMDAENARLRVQLFGKKKAPKKREGGSGARHMTGMEMMEALARADWEAHMTELSEIMKGEEAEKEKREEKERQAAERAATRAEAKRIADEVKAHAAAERQLARQAKQEERRIQKEAAAAVKKAAAEAKQAAAAAKHVAAQQKRLEAAEKRAEKARKSQVRKSRAAILAAIDVEDNENSDTYSEASSGSNLQPPSSPAVVPIAQVSRPKPRPRPIKRAEVVIASSEAVLQPEAIQNAENDVAEGGEVCDNATVVGRRSRRLASSKKD